MITLNLHTKLKTRQNCRAFTLAELLIVVAIIAVLVGISIPIFMSHLERSSEATDIANMRDAKAAAIELYYAGIDSEASAKANGLIWWEDKTYGNNAAGVYDAATGTIKPMIISNAKKPGYSNVKVDQAYGAGTASDGGTVFYGYDSTVDYTGAVIQITIFPSVGKKTLDAYYGSGNYDSSLIGEACIVLEWKYVGQSGSGGYVHNNSNLRMGQILFPNVS